LDFAFPGGYADMKAELFQETTQDENKVKSCCSKDGRISGRLKLRPSQKQLKMVVETSRPRLN
jgi:hypothetical protein